MPQRLKKIEVVEDDESDIIDSVRRLSNDYDFVVTRQVPSKSRHHESLVLTGSAVALDPRNVLGFAAACHSQF